MGLEVDVSIDTVCSLVLFCNFTLNTNFCVPVGVSVNQSVCEY